MSSGDLQGGDIEPGKMFIGGLSWDTTKENLTTYFATFGEVDDAVIMVDRVTNKPRGFGFVTFKDPARVASVLNHNQPHILDGKQIDPKPATHKNGPSSSTIPKKVFIGGLSPSSTVESITQYFKACKALREITYEILEVDLKTDKATNHPRGFGFVTFDTSEPVDILVRGKFQDIDGKKVEIKAAESRQPSQNQSYGTRQRGGMMGGYTGQGYSGARYGDQVYSQYRGYQQQQFESYPGYGYGSQGGGYSSAHPSGGYGAASYSSYPQSTGQQPVNSYQDQGYGTGYSASRTDATSYGQQQYSAAAYQQQGYGNTPSGNTGGRGQQPQGGYGYNSHGMH